MHFYSFYLAALALTCAAALPSLAEEVAATDDLQIAAKTPAASAGQMEEYRKLLANYNAAQKKYHDDQAAYWASIGEKRASRNAKRRSGRAIVLEDYLLTQPPVYTGPPPPVNPAAPKEKKPLAIYVPVVADFLKNAADKFQFVPKRPSSEIEFKRIYASSVGSGYFQGSGCSHLWIRGRREWHI
jgi:hypothetical protein